MENHICAKIEAKLLTLREKQMRTICLIVKRLEKSIDHIQKQIGYEQKLMIYDFPNAENYKKEIETLQQEIQNTQQEISINLQEFLDLRTNKRKRQEPEARVDENPVKKRRTQ